MCKLIAICVFTLVAACNNGGSPLSTRADGLHCGSTGEPCCLTPIGAPAGALIALCSPGLTCTVTPDTDTTAATCEIVK